MTLKNSFLTSVIENFKRRNWLFALSCLFFLLYLPVTSLVYLQHIRSYKEYGLATYIERIQNFLMEYTSLGYMTFLITFIAAIICALQGYAYLHNRQKIDFYHCLPVSKTKRFGIIYLNGYLAFFVPYLVSLCLTLLIMGMTPQIMTTALFCNALYSFFINQLCFLAIYNVTIVAVMLTGRGIITLLAIFVFFLYELMARFIISGYSSKFFKTYSSLEEQFITNITSPFIYIFQKMDSLDTNIISIADNFNTLTRMIPFLLIYIMLFGAVAYFLYLKRPSEAGGKAIAFSVAKPIIKILLVVPITLTSALFFLEITDQSILFMFFGLLLGLLISHALMEILYEFDLRAAFHNKKHLFISLGIVAIIYSIFQFDLIGYDKHTPNTSKLESAAISVYTDDYYYSSYDNGYMNLYWMDYQLEHMNLTDFDLINELIQASAEVNKTDLTSIENYMTFNIAFKLKSGKENYRKYTLDCIKNAPLLDRLFTTKEFKTGLHQIFDETIFSADQMVNFSTIYSNGYEDVSLTSQQAGELLEIYKREFLNCTFSEAFENTAVGYLNFTKETPTDNGNWTYPIYGSFTETLQYLKKNDLLLNNTIDPEAISNIEVIYEDYSESTSEIITKLYTDKEDIKAISKALLPSSLSFSTKNNYQNSYSDLYVRITYKDDAKKNKDDYRDNSLQLLSNLTPDFVLRDVGFKNQE